MTSIQALPLAPCITSSYSERINNLSPDPVASGFQTLLQNQVKASQRHALTVETMQLKQSANMSAHRLDTDTLLAQLLASRKMLLHPKNPACHSATTNRKALADCSLAYSVDTEPLAVSHPAHVHKVDSPCPPVAMAPLSYIFIWVPPEFVRFPVRFSNGQPLRIRRIRLLDRSGRRQNGNSHHKED